MVNTKICKDCKLEKSIDEFYLRAGDYGCYYRAVCTPCHNIRARKQNRKAKIKIIDHYSNGTNECACCKEKQLEFLTLDHTNGNGKKDRQMYGSGHVFYYHLIRNNFPEGFRILCYNCNCSKQYFGYCPHQKDKSREA